ncbi:MAG: nitrate/nitrite transporter NarK [Patiriisocius sp.]|jgi:nitrate/nitrite transporter NarK
MNEKKAPWHFLLLLILAGESVFILPFVLARIYRPTILEVFNLDNIQLGLCFSMYGVVALASYLIGGPIADKYPPNRLIAVALWTTSLGGLVYATIPDYFVLKALYGYWGFTTIFLAWAPMIKATRVWGGTSSQGKAFGFLDGGRGLVGALFGVVGLLIFAFFIDSEITSFEHSQTTDALRYVILVSSGIVFFVGILVWFFMKLDKAIEDEIVVPKITFDQIKEVMKLPSVWMLMIIILCAYMGYKATDIFPMYAESALGYDSIASAKVGTLLLFIRPIIGILIGITADRTKTIFWLPVSFALIFIGSILFSLGLVSSTSAIFFTLSTLVVACGVYAARSLYFAVMDIGKIPLLYTGTAVGLISLVGYTPDIFEGPLKGYLLDNSPGVIGQQHVFLMVAAFSLVGGVVSIMYYRLYK